MQNIFNWDDDKNKSNIRKHGVSFSEASTVFLDDDAILINDDSHSNNEERFVIIGFSKKPRLLVVCHCYRENDDIIRIISARKADADESEIYGGGK